MVGKRSMVRCHAWYSKIRGRARIGDNGELRGEGRRCGEECGEELG